MSDPIEIDELELSLDDSSSPATQKQTPLRSTGTNRDSFVASTPISILRARTKLRRNGGNPVRLQEPERAIDPTNIYLENRRDQGSNSIVGGHETVSEWPESLEGIDCANAERTAAGQP